MRILLVTLLIFCFVTTYSQKLVNTKIGDGISIKIPAEFINMSEADRIEKFVSTRIPLALYTTESRDVDLGINNNIMQWTKEDTKTVYGFYKASIRSLFDEMEFIQDTIKEINGREFIVFEFISTVRDTNAFSSRKGLRNYTYIQYTSYQDQVLLFNFGCRARIKNEWENVAKEIMQSVQIK